MGRFILKHIDMTLDPESIDNAIATVEKLQTDLEDALAELARYLTEERGPKIAQMYIAQFPAVDTGALSDSLEHAGKYDKKAHEGKIMTDLPYAVYVEYGTGVVGSDNPHPNPEGWEYDSKHHGMAGWWYPSEKGWYRPKDGNGVTLAWTKGMPARPFMYNTLLELSDIAEREGGQIIATYIP